MIPYAALSDRIREELARLGEVGGAGSRLRAAERRRHRTPGAHRAGRGTAGRAHGRAVALDEGQNRAARSAPPHTRIEIRRAPPRCAGRAAGGTAALRARARRALHHALRGAGLLSRTPDRTPHRRVVEHARAVPGRAPRRAGAERGGVLHHRGRRRRLHPAAQGRPVSRPHRAHRVRRRSLRHHAVHDRLRQRPAERVAHQRLERVHALSQSGHDHRRGHRSQRRICSAPSISPTRRAT